MSDATAKFPAATAALPDFGGEMPGIGENEWTANGATLIGAAAPFSLVVNEAIAARVPSTGWLTTANNEILHYSSVNTGTKTFTIDARALMDTAAAAIDSGSAVGQWMTKRLINQFMAEIIAMQAQDSGGANIASSGTTDLSTATGGYVQITGTTTITAFGTLPRGRVRVLEFAGSLTLTHNATSLVLRSGHNAITAAGDMYAFISEGAGNWRELFHAVAVDNDPLVALASYHRFHYEPQGAKGGVETFIGTGNTSVYATGRGQLLNTGATNPSSAGIRINSVNNLATDSLAVISKVRRIEFQVVLTNTFANSNSYVYFTDESSDVAPSATARHFGIKNLIGVVTFTTADGTTEQTTDLSAFFSAGGIAYVKILFDGTTARCYVNGTLRATHATNVPAAGGAPVFRALINNNTSANDRSMQFYAADALILDL